MTIFTDKKPTLNMTQMPACSKTLLQDSADLINKIHNENCLETMAKMPDNFVDITVTSPPYNMNLRIRNGKYCSRQIVKELSTNTKVLMIIYLLTSFMNYIIKY